MPSRGPKPKNPHTTNLQFRKGRPTCPSYLSKQAKAIHKAACDLLEEADVLQIADGAVIEAYATALARYRRLYQAVEAEGESIEGPRGGMARNPNDLALAAAHSQMLQAAGKLGMSPTDRERLSRPEAPRKKDRFDQFVES